MRANGSMKTKTKSTNESLPGVKGLVIEETELIREYLNGIGKKKMSIDVGAAGGGLCLPFLKNGWRVFAFEPNPVSLDMLKKLAKRHPQLHIDSRAVSDKTQFGLPFYTSSVSRGISGLHAFHDSHVQNGLTDTITLSEFCESNAIHEADLLKIDTEGNDLFVLKGFPWDSFKPQVIICEFEDGKTVPLGYTFHDMARFLIDQGYELLVSEWYPIERYGTKHSWRRFVSYPCELLDPDAWGNIIAFRDGLDWSRLTTAIGIWPASGTRGLRP